MYIGDRVREYSFILIFCIVSTKYADQAKANQAKANQSKASTKLKLFKLKKKHYKEFESCFKDQSSYVYVELHLFRSSLSPPCSFQNLQK